MLQLVKGGMYVFDWPQWGDKGRIYIPPEVLKEYGPKESEKLILTPGSKNSRGSGLALGFAIREPTVEEARKHPEIELF